MGKFQGVIGADHADRHADAHLELVRHFRRSGLAEEPAALAGHVEGHVDGFLDVAAGLGAHLAHLAHHQLGELVLAFDEPLGDPEENFAAARRRRRPPALVGLLRGLDGAVDIVDRRGRGGAQRLARGGVRGVERLASGGVHPFAADVVLRSLCRCGRHLAPCRFPPVDSRLALVPTVGDKASRTRRVGGGGHRALHGAHRRPQPAPLRRGRGGAVALRPDHRPGRRHVRAPGTRSWPRICPVPAASSCTWTGASRRRSPPRTRSPRRSRCWRRGRTSRSRSCARRSRTRRGRSSSTARRPLMDRPI